MKLFFSWQNESGIFVPNANSDVVNSEGVSILSCLLTDDGGLGRSEAISWIDEGIARLDKVLRGEAASLTWDREDWGSELKSDFVEIHSLHDDAYSQRIESRQFRTILASWKEFLQSGPKTAAVREFVV
jgi:hypothetical protein